VHGDRGAARETDGPPYCYDYPRPAVTVDLVAFAFAAGGLRTLFIRRKHDPFAGRWALPGGFLDIDEPIETAARRELREETGLDYLGPVSPIGVFGEPGRDPRGRTISMAYVAAIPGPIPEVSGGDDAADADWLDPKGPRELAFDHALIVAAALDWLHHEVECGPTGLAMLPDAFGDAEIKALHRAVGNPTRTATAWRSRMMRAGQIIPADGAGVGARYRRADP
jgi:8-oxo-dGTP diphosphatase